MLPSSTAICERLSPWAPGPLSLAIFALAVASLMAVILFLTWWLNPRRDTPEKSLPYESGVIPTGQARFRYPTPFYLVAAFFLIFDVEAAYIFTWAVSFERLDWFRWLQITFFIGVLLLSLFYIWRKGGLEWGANRR